MSTAPCLVFEDEKDWIVFAPLSRLVLRTNRSGAAPFVDFIDHGPEPTGVADERDFAPSKVSIALSNRCEQRCVYCYGTPIHGNATLLDPQCCAAGLELVAGNAAAAATTMEVHLHGVGEPTAAWPLFTETVSMIGNIADRYGVQARTSLCTGGQLATEQAAWVAEHVDTVQVSIDGPAELHCRQRPRRDGQDSLEQPLALARQVVARGKRLTVKTTVTAASVNRMVEIVDFVAETLGRVQLDLGMVFLTPWVRHERCKPPHWQDFVAGFGAALDRGAERGVSVGHPSISLAMLAGPTATAEDLHFCLAPPDVVTAFYDIPRERGADPRLGVYGRLDRRTGRLVIDHEHRRRLARTIVDQRCEPCPCRVACYGPGGVKGRMPEDEAVVDPVCRARVGVLKELLRRAVPKPPVMQEEST